jgi:hypothetical protein
MSTLFFKKHMYLQINTNTTFHDNSTTTRSSCFSLKACGEFKIHTTFMRIFILDIMTLIIMSKILTSPSNLKTPFPKKHAHVRAKKIYARILDLDQYLEKMNTKTTFIKIQNLHHHISNMHTWGKIEITSKSLSSENDVRASHFKHAHVRKNRNNIKIEITSKSSFIKRKTFSPALPRSIKGL